MARGQYRLAAPPLLLLHFLDCGKLHALYRHGYTSMLGLYDNAWIIRSRCGRTQSDDDPFRLWISDGALPRYHLYHVLQALQFEALFGVWQASSAGRGTAIFGR
jgi:hypothetical protein